MSWIANWDRFYSDHPHVKCETCGFVVKNTMHYFTRDDPNGLWDGLSCDPPSTGFGALPLGNRRRSIFKGFNDTVTPTTIVSTECKCDMKDLISPCGHSKDCGYMLNKRRVA